MIASATHHISLFNVNYVRPCIDWSRRHKLLISVIAISILLATACYNSPQAFDMMKKNIKFLTIVVPIAYTLPAPLVGIGFVMAGGSPLNSNSDRSNLVQMFETYCNSIVKVWQAWFRFVGIS